MIGKDVAYICPFCDADDTEILSEEQDEDTLDCELQCKKCKKVWVDHFKLVYNGCTFRGEDEKLHRFDKYGEEYD